MIIINNGPVSRRNIISVSHGTNVEETGKFEEFNQKKIKDSSDIDKITIDSKFVDVHVLTSNSSKIQAHFYGEANIDGDVIFDVQVVNRELRITLKFTGICVSGNLNLDVTVPHKMFDMISLRSSSADFTLNEGVLTDYLKMETKSGDLETHATVNNVSVSTMSGDIDLYINAEQDVSVKISTKSGDVSVEFNNIRHVNLSTSSMSGKVRNRHNGNRGFTANVNISTMSGDIKIR